MLNAGRGRIKEKKESAKEQKRGRCHNRQGPQPPKCVEGLKRLVTRGREGKPGWPNRSRKKLLLYLSSQTVMYF